METLFSHTKKLWQAAKGGVSCTNDTPDDDDFDTEDALSKESVLQDPPRVRVVPRRDGGGSNRAARTTTAVKYHMSLMNDETPAEHANSTNTDIEQGSAHPSTNGSTEGLTGTASEETKRKMQELEKAQTEAREQELMNLDWRCWKQLATEGYFQRAEDDLTAAARLEQERNGNSDRYASLLYALAALYDNRSYADVTGQANALSLTSAQYAEESLNIRMQLQAAKGEAGTREEELLLAETMVLYGNSLANYALEVRGVPKMPPSKAFADAKKYVAAALEIRTKYQDRATVPENTFTLGYVYFCHAQCFLNRPHLAHVYAESADGAGTALESATALYKQCLQHYFHAAGLHAERDGEEAEASIRMVCNVALATSHMAEIDAAYLPDAEQWYTKAIAVQEKVFGPGHRRTRMLKQDLAKLKLRGEAAAVGAATADAGAPQAGAEGFIPESPGKSDKELERERDKDALMQEFLSARRRERDEEQKGRYASP